ncbi:MAG: hypothetical protein AAGG81_03290 [Chlamydiota bacterium]
MPRSFKLKPLINDALDNISSFRQEYENSLSSEDPENEIDDSYHSFVENLHRNLEDFQDYRNHQLNEDDPKCVKDEMLESIVSSIFNIEENESILERSERVQQIQNALFWDAIKDIEGQLQYLDEEVEKLKLDD